MDECFLEHIPQETTSELGNTWDFEEYVARILQKGSSVQNKVSRCYVSAEIRDVIRDAMHISLCRYNS